MPESNQPLSVRDQVQSAGDAVRRAFVEAWQLQHDARMIAGAGTIPSEEFTEAGIRELEVLGKASATGVINPEEFDPKKFTDYEYQEILSAQKAATRAAVRLVHRICRVLKAIGLADKAREIGDVYLRFSAAIPHNEIRRFGEGTGTDFHKAALSCCSRLVSKLLVSIETELAIRAGAREFPAGWSRAFSYNPDTYSKPWSRNKKRWVVDAVLDNPKAIQAAAEDYDFPMNEIDVQLRHEYAVVLAQIEDVSTDRPAVVTEEHRNPDASHGTGFRSVRWFGKVYSFTEQQAQAVRVLWENWERGTPDVGDETLLVAVDSERKCGGRIQDLFRGCDAWQTMIISGETRGTRRLAEPSK